MKVKFESIALEIDPRDFKEAATRIESATSQGPGVLDAMFVLLLIRFLDQTKPGTAQMILDSIDEASIYAAFF